jgi:hypothetical protein
MRWYIGTLYFLLHFSVNLKLSKEKKQAVKNPNKQSIGACHPRHEPRGEAEIRRTMVQSQPRQIALEKLS